MQRNTWSVALAAGLIVVGGQFAGCSSIDRSSELAHNRLEVGVATKSQVVDAIGLPAKTSRDDAQHVEFWYYTGKPEMSSYFIPMPIARSHNVVYSLDSDPSACRAVLPSC